METINIIIDDDSSYVDLLSDKEPFDRLYDHDRVISKNDIVHVKTFYPIKINDRIRIVEGEQFDFIPNSDENFTLEMLLSMLCFEYRRMYSDSDSKFISPLYITGIQYNPITKTIVPKIAF